jgi:hypothetical protein
MKRRDHRELVLLAARGMRVAVILFRVVSALSLLVLGMGCIVTDSVDFPVEENHPPSVVTVPGRSTPPLDRIVKVNLDAVAESETGAEIPFRVVVTDPNVSQDLAYNTFINFQPEIGRPGPRGGNVVPAAGSEERELTFDIPVSELQPAGQCYRLELLVSSDFTEQFPFRTPVLEKDLAVAVWFIEVTGGGTLEIDPRYRCPAREAP